MTTIYSQKKKIVLLREKLNGSLISQKSVMLPLK